MFHVIEILMVSLAKYCSAPNNSRWRSSFNWQWHYFFSRSSSLETVTTYVSKIFTRKASNIATPISSASAVFENLLYLTFHSFHNSRSCYHYGVPLPCAITNDDNKHKLCELNPNI